MATCDILCYTRVLSTACVLDYSLDSSHQWQNEDHVSHAPAAAKNKFRLAVVHVGWGLQHRCRSTCSWI